MHTNDGLLVGAGHGQQVDVGDHIIHIVDPLHATQSLVTCACSTVHLCRPAQDHNEMRNARIWGVLPCIPPDLAQVQMLCHA